MFLERPGLLGPLLVLFLEVVEEVVALLDFVAHLILGFVRVAQHLVDLGLDPLEFRRLRPLFLLGLPLGLQLLLHLFDLGLHRVGVGRHRRLRTLHLAEIGVVEVNQQQQHDHAGRRQGGSPRHAHRETVADAQRIDALVGVGQQGDAGGAGGLVGPEHQRSRDPFLEAEFRIQGQRGLHGRRLAHHRERHSGARAGDRRGAEDRPAQPAGRRLEQQRLDHEPDGRQRQGGEPTPAQRPDKRLQEQAALDAANLTVQWRCGHEGSPGDSRPCDPAEGVPVL